MEVTARKTTKSEAKELYNELIQKYIDAIERKKSNNTKKHNILKILNNVGTIFTGTYLHHKDVPKKNVTKLKRKEQNINNEFFKEYFDYQSPSNMYTKVRQKV